MLHELWLHKSYCTSNWATPSVRMLKNLELCRKFYFFKFVLLKKTWKTYGNFCMSRRGIIYLNIFKVTCGYVAVAYNIIINTWKKNKIKKLRFMVLWRFRKTFIIEIFPSKKLLKFFRVDQFVHRFYRASFFAKSWQMIVFFCI